LAIGVNLELLAEAVYRILTNFPLIQIALIANKEKHCVWQTFFQILYPDGFEVLKAFLFAQVEY
jgi:hypothetical protein